MERDLTAGLSIKVITRLALAIIDIFAAVAAMRGGEGAVVPPGKAILAALADDVLTFAVLDRNSAFIADPIGGIGGIQDTFFGGHSG
jgi:hypothetical protein